ncbi:hypothetical protein [Dictyobacter formicarum]|uniref:hypothetical protein n=1 Tax=Dictyobacter formicarum TaxID=2778368 RepID=UPI00191645B9|nr:hypothetical protein [Dictyobacter formicarum]
MHYRNRALSGQLASIIGAQPLARQGLLFAQFKILLTAGSDLIQCSLSFNEG